MSFSHRDALTTNPLTNRCCGYSFLLYFPPSAFINRIIIYFGTTIDRPDASPFRFPSPELHIEGEKEGKRRDATSFTHGRDTHSAADTSLHDTFQLSTEALESAVGIGASQPVVATEGMGAATTVWKLCRELITAV